MAAKFPEVGRVSFEDFDGTVLPRLGKRRRAVKVGSRHGVGIAVVETAAGQVQAVTTGPVFVVPAPGWERAARFAVHLLASDAACTGLPAFYATFELHLPISLDRAGFDALWRGVHGECERLGVTIAAVRAGRYPGCGWPMVGGATLVSAGAADRWVDPAMARVGDHVVVTKGAGIGAAAVLAAAHGDSRADRLLPLATVVEDARVAVRAGTRDDGVTSLHAAAEGGVWGGLVEVARAAGLGLAVERDRVPLDADAVAVCEEAGIDPYLALGRGALIATCRPARSGRVVALLARAGIRAAVVGEIVPARRGARILEGGRERPLEHPRIDPFWEAFRRAASEIR